MNSEAQRARNKRKRDKLRAKRQAERTAAGIYRFKLEGKGLRFTYQCGLMPREYGHSLCTKVAGFTENHNCEWETGWIYSSTHDLSSSALDAIQAFNNTWKEMFYHTTKTVVLIVQVNGQERRKVWQGHTYAADVAAKQVCSFVKQLFSGESEQTPSIQSHYEELSQLTQSTQLSPNQLLALREILQYPSETLPGPETRAQAYLALKRWVAWCEHQA